MAYIRPFAIWELARDLDRFESVGEMIEAIYRHIHYYNHSHSHTALRMLPAVYAALMFSDTCLHKLGT